MQNSYVNVGEVVFAWNWNWFRAHSSYRETNAAILTKNFTPIR